MYVIGTAGHVDHGKSSLVEALSGMDPDRLKEEKERAMTIDLGFAWMTLSDGQQVGIIDVPGHRDFIENMLAGVGGIDMALFVIAADEGVMPQTMEHLAILDLLQIKGGVVALTKVDLIDDPEWLELVDLDVREAIMGTVLETAPIVRVSSRTGLGVAELAEVIRDQLERLEARPDYGRPSLPIDRVFSLPGFGTVVTGTLSGGKLRVGDQVEIQPGDRRARIRGLQTHGESLEEAGPGSRVAVNLSGIRKNEIDRGDVLARPGVVTTTLLCDVSYRHLADSVIPLKHNVSVKVFVGANEVMAKTRVLGNQQIAPGEIGWLQLALSEPVAMVRNDRFILRRPSPQLTLGGGRILDPHPGKKHRRFDQRVIERLVNMDRGSPADRLLETIHRYSPAPIDQIVARAGMGEEDAVSAWNELLKAERAQILGDFVLPEGGLGRWSDRLMSILRRYHARAPLRPGMPREELRSRLDVTADFFTPLIDSCLQRGLIEESGGYLRLSNHRIRFTQAQQTAIDRLMDRFQVAGVNSPSVKESRAAVGDEVYQALVELGQLKQISSDVVYRQVEYQLLVEQVKDHLHENESIDAAQLRDLLGTSRKYAIALLEHLDEIRVTRRVDDKRVLI